MAECEDDESETARSHWGTPPSIGLGNLSLEETASQMEGKTWRFYSTQGGFYNQRFKLSVCPNNC